MIWKYARAVIHSLFWLIVAGAANLLGVAPEMVIARILGPEETARIINLMSEINAEALRWAFVILGNAATAMALLWLIRIPQWRLDKQIKDSSLVFEEKLKLMADDLKAAKGEIAASRKYSRKKELSAKRLHAMTKEAIEKWRLQKTGENTSNLD